MCACTKEELAEHASQNPTSVQIANLQTQLTNATEELSAIRRLLEQDGKKKERRSLPKLQLPELPRPSAAWLIPLAILFGLLAAWYSWAALWNGVTTLFP